MSEDVERYRAALQSIAGSACCSSCQEAKLVAQAALNGAQPTDASTLASLPGSSTPADAEQREGFVLVPREPTEEMLSRIANAATDFMSERGLYPRSRAMYRAMLAASPSPQEQPVDGRLIRQATLNSSEHRYDLQAESEDESRFADQPAPSPDAIRDIEAERRRQVEAEGWTPEHDDRHNAAEMAQAAACYAQAPGHRDLVKEGASEQGAWLPRNWPWDRNWWKPKDRRRDLVRAGALIVAEIERLDRAAIRALKGQP